jgi:putative transposase
MVERPGPLALSRQCQLLGLNRAALYYQAAPVDAYEPELMTLLDRQYLRTPFYGSRRMTAWLQTQGYGVNRKRVQRLMQRMGLAAIYQRPRTSRPASAPDLSLPVTRAAHRAGPPGVGGRHHPIFPWRAGFFTCRGDGLGQPLRDALRETSIPSVDSQITPTVALPVSPP